jgi:hypothetical protein
MENVHRVLIALLISIVTWVNAQISRRLLIPAFIRMSVGVQQLAFIMISIQSQASAQNI